jgi:hypothetical protein
MAAFVADRNGAWARRAMAVSRRHRNRPVSPPGAGHPRRLDAQAPALPREAGRHRDGARRLPGASRHLLSIASGDLRSG